jgi:Sec-independent protein translocase protein TatA
MDILGIGPLELILVIIMVILVFGPNDLQNAGRKIGRILNQAMKSDTWKAIRSVSQEIRTLPNKLAREAELESYLADEAKKTIAPPKTTKEEDPLPPIPEEFSYEEGIKAWTTPPTNQTNEEEK